MNIEDTFGRAEPPQASVVPRTARTGGRPLHAPLEQKRQFDGARTRKSAIARSNALVLFSVLPPWPPSARP